MNFFKINLSLKTTAITKSKSQCIFGGGGLEKISKVHLKGEMDKKSQKIFENKIYIVKLE